jgi:hypothetical protein
MGSEQVGHQRKPGNIARVTHGLAAGGLEALQLRLLGLDGGAGGALLLLRRPPLRLQLRLHLLLQHLAPPEFRV